MQLVLLIKVFNLLKFWGYQEFRKKFLLIKFLIDLLLFFITKYYSIDTFSPTFNATYIIGSQNVRVIKIFTKKRHLFRLIDVLLYYM